MTDDVKEAAIMFEAVKTSITQTKDGVILRLAIHPEECPIELLRSWVGSRFGVVMVQIGDDEQPVMSDATRDANRSLKSAIMLCKDKVFQEFMGVENEHECANTMRHRLGVSSRSEIKNDTNALDRFQKLRSDFIEWRRVQP